MAIHLGMVVNGMTQTSPGPDGSGAAARFLVVNGHGRAPENSFQSGMPGPQTEVHLKAPLIPREIFTEPAKPLPRRPP